ncbi:MAG: hypothetical protein Kow009_14480 [Spirochaetales bacterium]
MRMSRIFRPEAWHVLLGCLTLLFLSQVPIHPAPILPDKAVPETGTPASAREEPEAEPEPEPEPEPETLLGLTLEQAFERLGPPHQVGVVRGSEPWQDDVLFIYPKGLSLFWFQDRVWQVRFSPPFTGDVRGIRIGDTRDHVLELLGNPYFSENDWILYHFAGSSYPIRLRVFFREGLVEDMYLYRGDF